jgi:hypothetical protein
MFRFKNVEWLFVALAVLILASSVYAIAASNTIPTSKAGDGSGVINGYTVSNIQWMFNADYSKIMMVKFNLDSIASMVKAKFISTGLSWYSCTYNVSEWECDTTSPQLSLTDADQLRVIAIQ